MRVIIAGGRSFNDRSMVDATMAMIVSQMKWEISTIISGGASGADTLGEEWARSHAIPIERYEAQWRVPIHHADGTVGYEIDRTAGVKRNEQMACVADALVAFPGGRGTADMVKRAHKHGLRIYNVCDLQISLL